ncbi:MAG: bifunctional N-acetylglucosamine-1-phosphate uridyltransferase/glucosamine-1-phosphate acetyltransferase [Rhodospirillaceae bacterium]|nr:bifunctional N-acetylglucosamine-1-phosphate uridyltransferase/glucosamine-1-phosphate acetyltransferase [Rhodospirillaceae bacterium]
MTTRSIAAVVLAAGKGTRMKSDLPKVLHPLAGRPMVGHLLATVDQLEPERTVVVVGHGMEAVSAAVGDRSIAVQEPQRGTGHAVMQARAALDGFEGDVLVLYGDTPLLTQATLEAMVEARNAHPDTAVVVLGMRPDDPGEYGRLVLGADGMLDAIVEFKDADESVRALDLCNSGVMAIDAARLFPLLDQVTDDNAKGEYYLTDIVGLARRDGLRCAVVEADVDELMGVNSRVDLAAAEAAVQERMRREAMLAGATLTDPGSVWFCHDTTIGRDVIIGPNVVFGPGVTIGDRVEIRPFCHIEGATVAAGATVGPFARLRPGAAVGEDAHIGNFVEIKKATVEQGAKVNHLTYIGDARVGAKANIGAGTITCNYDGFNKAHTDIGAGAFIGSNSALVAPVAIGAGAVIGAGSVITRDVEADALAVTRAETRAVAGWAAKNRARKAKPGKTK